MRRELKLFLILIKLVNGSHLTQAPSPVRPAHLIADGVRCGAETFSRIVGGGVAKAHSWPWIVRVLVNGYQSCSGSNWCLLFL